MVSSASLSPRRARIAHVLGALFLLVGLSSALATVGSAVRPGLSVHCGADGCFDRTSLTNLAPGDARAALERASAKATFQRYVARPPVRLGLMMTALIAGMPFAALMAAVGLALRKLAARRGDDLAGALPWLRRSALAALSMAVATPVADSLQAMILFPGTPLGSMWYAEVDVRQLSFDLLLAGAALAVVWALDAGSRAERDVAAFV